MPIHPAVEDCRLASIVAHDRMLDADAAARVAESGRLAVRAALDRGDYASAHASLRHLRRVAGGCREDAYEARDAANACREHAATVADARGRVAAAVATGQFTHRADYAADQADERKREAARAFAHARLDWTAAQRRLENA